jgi:hypothetical protein
VRSVTAFSSAAFLAVSAATGSPDQQVDRWLLHQREAPRSSAMYSGVSV